jgi:hypothetical protein
MSWQSDVVDCMLDLRRDGLAFDVAWTRAIKLHPPRPRDLGPERPQLWQVPEETVVEHFRRSCSDAWHNRRPALAHFHPSLLIARDEDGPGDTAAQARGMTCKACGERPVDHPTTGECHRCLQRRWMAENPHHNRREGKRAEQKRAWDRAHSGRRSA